MTVIDTTAPNVYCINLELTLENGFAEVTYNDINDNSFDNCGSIESIELSQTEFSENDIGENIVYMTVIDSNGNSSVCEAIIMINPGLGINDDIDENIIIYPNPTEDMLFISGNENELEVSVYDLLGKRVMKVSVVNRIDISLLSNGTYLVYINNGSKVSQYKIIKK